MSEIRHVLEGPELFESLMETLGGDWGAITLEKHKTGKGRGEDQRVGGKDACSDRDLCMLQQEEKNTACDV